VRIPQLSPLALRGTPAILGTDEDYNKAKKIRAVALRELQKSTAPDNSDKKHFEQPADEYIRHRETPVSAGTVRLENEGLGALERFPEM
jgi:hypothetical protein